MFPKNWPLKSSKNCHLQQPHSYLTSTPRGTPTNIRIRLVFPKTRLACTFLAVSMGLPSYKFVEWAPKTHIFCNRVRFGRSKSSKVDDFCTNRKRVCDFLFVRHCDYGPILHRFWDTATYWLKIAYLLYRSFVRRPRSLCSVWNFALKVTIRKLESWGWGILQWTQWS